MQQHLNLIKTEFKQTEKRIFPRFPFTYLTFKAKNGEDKVFEVKDISFTGMQVALKDGGHSYVPGKDVQGTLHWRGAALNLKTKVMWVTGHRLGLEFISEGEFEKEIRNFLSVENIVSGMRPIHSSKLDIDMPSDLKYWLQADGPVEIFVWRHNDGEISRFHTILLDSYVEWEDGKGVTTGQILTKRNVDTPLVHEDEFLFELDESADVEKIEFAKNIVNKIPENYIPVEAIEFLKTKLG